MGKRDELLRAVQRANRALREHEERIARFGPEPDNGTVIRFQSDMGGKYATRYTFVGLRTPNGWYITGKTGSEVRTWPELCEIISGTGFEVAFTWEKRGVGRPVGTAFTANGTPVIVDGPVHVADYITSLRPVGRQGGKISAANGWVSDHIHVVRDEAAAFFGASDAALRKAAGISDSARKLYMEARAVVEFDGPTPVPLVEKAYQIITAYEQAMEAARTDQPHQVVNRNETTSHARYDLGPYRVRHLTRSVGLNADSTCAGYWQVFHPEGRGGVGVVREFSDTTPDARVRALQSARDRNFKHHKANPKATTSKLAKTLGTPAPWTT